MDGQIFFAFSGEHLNLFTLLRDYYKIGQTVQQPQQQQCSENLQFFVSGHVEPQVAYRH